MIKGTVWLTAALTVAVSVAGAQDFPAALTAGRKDAKLVVSPGTKRTPRIDGVLDDACWRQAGSVTGFLRMKHTQRAGVQTTVRFNHTRDALYIAAIVADPKIVGKERKRDAGTWEDDCVEFFLDPRRGRQDRFHIIISAAGMIYDARLGKSQWNAGPALLVAAKRYPGKGWTVELRVPFKTLETDRPRQGEVWDLKLAREDYDAEGGVPRLSAWQYIGNDFSDAGAYGRLVFASENCAYNGDFSKGYVRPKPGETWTRTHWRITPQTHTRNKADLVLDATQGHTAPPCGKVTAPKNYAQAQMVVFARPHRKYRV